jgi:hypothetical protein
MDGTLVRSGILIRDASLRYAKVGSNFAYSDHVQDSALQAGAATGVATHDRHRNPLHPYKYS